MVSMLPLINCLPDSVIIKLLEGKSIFGNEAAQLLSGYSLADLIRTSPGVHLTEENVESIPREIENVLSSSESRKGLLKQKRKDGTFYWEEFELFPVCDIDGTIIALASKEQLETQEQLKESEERYCKQAELSPDAIVVHSEVPVLTDGSEAVGKVKAVPISGGNNCVLIVARNISERQNIETELREQKKELQEQLAYAQTLNKLAEITIINNDIQQILDSMANIIAETINVDHCLIYRVDFEQNRLIARCQYTKNNLPKIPIPPASFTLDINETARNFFWNNKNMLESHTDQNTLLLMNAYMAELFHDTLKIQSFFWYPFAFTPRGYYALAFTQLNKTRKLLPSELEFLDSAIKQVEIAIQKITYFEELKFMKDALKKAEKEKDLILSSISELVLFLDTNMRIKWANTAVVENVGMAVEDLAGLHCYEVWQGTNSPCPDCPVKATLRTGEKQRREMNTPDGKIWRIKGFPVFDEDGNEVGAVEVAKDITAAKQVEKEMARLERLNLIGEMAAGFGHEIRNPMATVRGFLQFISGKENSLPYRRYFDLMIEEMDRANAIISEFLSLAKHKAIDLKLDSLNAAIEAIYPLILADAIHNDQSIELELTDIPELLMDKKETHQLILNLVRNGLEAMPAGGYLLIRTYSEADEVVMAVQDHGNGIEPEIMNRLGIPFVTTKENGTGLGLAICYSIVERHNAKIEVESSFNGTTFYIRYKKAV